MLSAVADQVEVETLPAQVELAATAGTTAAQVLAVVEREIHLTAAQVELVVAAYVSCLNTLSHDIRNPSRQLRRQSHCCRRHAD
jgi:hypothetical protein